MKKLTLILAILILVGCKKEEPEPTPTPTQSTNYFTLNGTEYPMNATDTARYWISGNVTSVNCEIGNRFFTVSFPGTDTIDYHVLGQQSVYFTVFSIAGEGYSRPDVWIHVSQYDSIGGRIIGTFEGTVKQNSDTTVVLPVSGAFNVLRGDDI